MGRKRKHSEEAFRNDCGAEGRGAAADGDLDSTSTDVPDGSEGTGSEKPPVQRNAANERERARMRVLSKAFTRLKTSLPWVPADTKLSKLDTLRLASCYIAHLSQLLAEDGEEQTTSGGKSNSSISSTTTVTSTNIHPLNLTWPFTFSSRNSLTSSSSSSAIVGESRISRSNSSKKYSSKVETTHDDIWLTRWHDWRDTKYITLQFLWKYSIRLSCMDSLRSTNWATFWNFFRRWPRHIG